MKTLKKILIICTIFTLTANMIFPKSAWCITIKEEEELSREFMKMILRQVKVIKDPFIVNYVNKIGRKILSTLPPQPFEYKFHVIKANDYNAFAIPAGQIFIHSGLLMAMESEEELAGIIAHETAHVVCRHISQKIERSSKISLLTVAGIVAAIFLGAAGGSATASEAIGISSMAAAQSLSLAYSREDERQADHRGLEYLSRAGYKASGLLNILKKIRDKRWFGPDLIPTYLTTHPAIEDRITDIDTWLASGRQQSAVSRQQTDRDQSEFQKARNRLIALYGDKETALKTFKEKITNNPEDTAANHEYGLILARTGNYKEAVIHLKKALEKRAFDAQTLKDLGRVYLLDGQHPEALKSLKGALSIEPNDPEGLLFMGRAQMELKKFQKAASVFEDLMEKYPDTRQDVLYPLAEAYGRQEKQDKAHYYLGLFHDSRRDFKNAVFHLKNALKLTQDPEKKAEIEELLKEIQMKIKKQAPPKLKKKYKG
ncbi:MAG: M48 family metalloprotease [Desulfobacteraceae bacterium]|nr:M48 family metalloprotease [Desulfobacteraceae bacterium]